MTALEHAYWLKQAKWISRQLAPAHLAEDMVAECMASLVVALRTYDVSRNDSLGAYVLQKMRWACLDALRAQRPGTRTDTEKGMFYEQSQLDEARDAGAPPTVSTDGIDLQRAIAKLPAKRRGVVEAYLRRGDVALAAKAVGMTANCGHQHIWQAVRDLRKLMT